MNRLVPALVIAISALSAAACGSSNPPPTVKAPSVSASAETAANPVTILRNAGVTPEPGSVNGDHDIYGNRDASGTVPGCNCNVTVYVSATAADFTASSKLVAPDDHTGVVKVPALKAVFIINGYGTPAQTQEATHSLANKIGGTVK